MSAIRHTTRHATRHTEVVDAVVVGAGHHGLVAAATLADAGWDVAVLEARDHVGGALWSVDRDGWVMDEFSACHPLAAASPVFAELGLEEHGLRWSRSDTVLAHVGSPDDREGAVIRRTPEETAASLEADRAGDGDAWLALCAEWRRLREPLLRTLLTRWPPVAPGLGLARAVRGRDLLRFARFLLLPVARMGEELFRGERARSLLAGNAMHVDISPEAPGSGVFGWLLAMLAQDVGFPSPVGGSRSLALALAARAEQPGAVISTGDPVVRIVARGGRADAVHTSGGRVLRARRAVIADTSAPALYDDLLQGVVLPQRVRHDLDRFAWDLPTLKLNYRLSATLPWTARHARDSAVVHLGADTAGLVRWSADLATGVMPHRPFSLVGQMTTVDPTRSPDGTQAMWLYTHPPRGRADDASADAMTGRVEGMLDEFAPGWRELVLERWDQRPSDLESSDANLVGGAIGGGTSGLHQQLVFRPVTALGGPRTPVDNLYLGSAAIHPGGGVHGGCGLLAARAALADHGRFGGARRRLARGALRRVQGTLGD